MKSIGNQQSDEQLLELLREGDRAALESIYFRYADFLFRFSFKRLNCKDTAADLVQELFLKLWIKRESLAVKGELQAYLTFCLRNLVIDHYSREQVRSKYRELTERQEIDNSTVNSIDYNDTLQNVQSGINGLPDKMRQIFQLSKMKDYSIDEIADELNLSRQTVKNQLGSAVKKLRVSLGAFFTL
jgi:RNA polymerase sigma-70 factor (ECF subfamily)